MKILSLLILASFFSSCAAFHETTEQRRCFKDVLSQELFILRSLEGTKMMLESLEDRRQLAIELNQDRYTEMSCTLRDQFKTHH